MVPLVRVLAEGPLSWLHRTESITPSASVAVPMRVRVSRGSWMFWYRPASAAGGWRLPISLPHLPAAGRQTGWIGIRGRSNVPFEVENPGLSPVPGDAGREQSAPLRAAYRFDPQDSAGFVSSSGLLPCQILPASPYTRC